MPERHYRCQTVMSNLDRIIGMKIKIIRTSKNLEQQDLAQMVNISQSFLSRIESGDRSLSAQLFCAIAIALEIDEAELNPYKNSPVWSPVTLPISFQTQNKCKFPFAPSS